MEDRIYDATKWVGAAGSGEHCQSFDTRGEIHVARVLIPPEARIVLLVLLQW